MALPPFYDGTVITLNASGPGEVGAASRTWCRTLAVSSQPAVRGPHGAHRVAAVGLFTVTFIESDWYGNNCTNIIDIKSTPGCIYI